MKTEFITLTFNLAEPSSSWAATIEDRLRTYGEPLRWAITQVDASSHLATIEAVITQDTQP